MNPLRHFEDRKKLKKAGEEILDVLVKNRPKGIELPRDAEVEAAVVALLGKHPELTVVKTERSLSLYFHDDFDPLISKETHSALDEAGILSMKDKVKHG